MSNVKSKRKRHSGSDGLRVIAMLGVAAFHIRPDYIPGGFLGVVIFLVLAGYYTTRSFTVRPKLNLGRYYTNKVDKLWPPLLFMMVLVGLFSAFFLPQVFSYFRESAPSAALGWHNIAEILKDRSYFERHGAFDPLTHLWAMSLEMQYYAIFPLIYLALSKFFDRVEGTKRYYGREIAGGVLLFLGLITAIYMAVKYNPVGDPTPYYYNSFMRANAFLNGAGICLIMAGRQMRQAYLVDSGQEDTIESKSLHMGLRTSLTWGLLIFMVASFFIFDAESTFLYRGGFYLYSFAAVAYILLGGVKPVPGMAWMDSKPLRYLASRSYHIYLWQYAIQIMLEAGLRFSTMRFAGRLIIQLVLVMVLAELTYQIFDKADRVRPKVRRLVAIVLALILFTLIILPAEREPAAPDLEGDAVLEAIRANEAHQSDLAAKESRREAQASRDKAEGRTKETRIRETLNMPSETEDILDQNDGYITSENPYGYSKTAQEILEQLNLVIVGDSVMAMAMEGIRAYVPRVYIDAAVSRHFFQGPGIVQGLDAAGIRGDILVIALSTNGDIQEEDIDTFVKIAGERPIIFINTVVPGNWERSNNAKLDRAAAKYANVFVGDWYGKAKHVPEYFYQDATHPVPLGADAYDQVILETILQVIASGEYKLNDPIHFPASPPVTSPTNAPAPQEPVQQPTEPASPTDSQQGQGQATQGQTSPSPTGDNKVAPTAAPTPSPTEAPTQPQYAPTAPPAPSGETEGD